MAKDQRNVEAITPMEEDFAKWYTDICLKAELVDYASVKGFLILRPYGYAIWENIQAFFDEKIRASGVKVCYGSWCSSAERLLPHFRLERRSREGEGARGGIRARSGVGDAQRQRTVRYTVCYI
mgnify:CR=1 FL=1